MAEANPNHVGGADSDFSDSEDSDDFEIPNDTVLNLFNQPQLTASDRQHMTDICATTEDERVQLKRLYECLVMGDTDIVSLVEQGTVNLNTPFYLKCKSDCYCGHYFEYGHQQYVEKFMDRVMKGYCECVEGTGDSLTNEGRQLAVVYPVHVAARQGHLWLIEYFIQEGVQLDRQTKLLHKTAFHLAIEYSHVDVLALLVKSSSVSTCDTQDYHGHSPLILAAKKLYYGHEAKMLDVLLEKGCNVNLVNQRSETALLIIICDNSPYDIKKLIESGADVNISNTRGIAPLTYAVRNNRNEVVEILIQAGANVNKPSIDMKDSDFPLHLAVHYGNIKCVNLLLSAGALPDVKGESGYTPLHTAAFSNYPSICELLLQYSQDVNITNNHSYTALHLAAWEGHIDIVNMLLKKAALHDTVTADKNTQLALAAHGHHPDIIDVLLPLGCNVNNMDKDLDTPLMYCAYNGDFDSCRKLIELGANVNAKNSYNATALWNAVHTKHPKVVRLLLEHNADMDIASKGIDQRAHARDVVPVFDEPWSPFMVACLQHDYRMATMLAMAGYAITDDDSKELLRLLSLVGNKPVSEHDKEMKKLYDLCCNPYSLKRIVRNAVRQNMGQKLIVQVETLEIPRCLKDFLILKEL